MMDAKHYFDYQSVVEHTDLRRLSFDLIASFRSGDKKEISTPDRGLMFQHDPEAVFVSMPAASSKYGLYINKVASIFERQPCDPLDTIQALVIAFSAKNGLPIALLDGSAITNIKCAAVSAAVTELCAIKTAKTLAIIGSGVQARQQVAGVLAVRDIETIILNGRTRNHVECFADEIKAQHRHINIVIEDDIDKAINHADIVSTTTTSVQPLTAFDGLLPHVHINCMGGHTEHSREVPNSLLESYLVVVEDIKTAIDEAGLAHQSAIELSELARKDVDVIRKQATIFSSTGHSSLDLITTSHVLKNLQLI